MNELFNDVREQLRALPEAPLPDSLWLRVEAGRRKKVRRRKLGVRIASLSLVAVIAVPLLLFDSTRMMKDKQTVALQPVRVQQDIRAEVRALDLALQAAYDRGASDAEIAPMWVARDALLSSHRSASATARPNQI